MRHAIIEEDLQRIASEGLPWAQFAGKTVLVTGASGMLPAYLVEALLFLNEMRPGQHTHVLALVRDGARAQSRFRHYQSRTDLSFVVQDICAPLGISQHVDFIVHAASQASPRYFGKDPVGTLLPNVLGTQQLLNLARDHRVQGFLFFSSGEVYGQVDDAHPLIAERGYGYLDPTALRSCYAESKRMGETMCIAWAAQYGVPVRIARPFHTYGPGLRLDDGRVFADFVSDIISNRDIRLKSDGRAVRSFCYLADATAGFLTVLLRGQDAEAYNVGNEEATISMLDLANTLVGLFPEKRLRVLRETGRVAPGYLASPFSRNCPDTSKLRSLGWAPRTSIPEGFRRTIGSFQ